MDGIITLTRTRKNVGVSDRSVQDWTNQAPRRRLAAEIPKEFLAAGPAALNQFKSPSSRAHRGLAKPNRDYAGHLLFCRNSQATKSGPKRRRLHPEQGSRAILSIHLAV